MKNIIVILFLVGCNQFSEKHTNGELLIKMEDCNLKAVGFLLSNQDSCKKYLDSARYWSAYYDGKNDH